MLKMTYIQRIYYTDEQKALMWDPWQKGDSMHPLAGLFNRGHSSVQGILSKMGGVEPATRSRSRLSLRLAEREVISRGVVAGQSFGSIEAALARALNRESRGQAKRRPSCLQSERRRSGSLGSGTSSEAS